MATDISSMSRKELEQLRKDIDRQLEKRAKDEQKAALEAAERAAREYGFSLSELTGSSGGKRSKSGSVNPPKYRNPDNPEQTWTGKGRRPEWIKDAQKKGEDLKRFEIS
ncbi:H-NS histone family protein [Histidinibacterium aquaticum]|uniref:H-NS histone family protein n=1 Tax=Histidinibacterium aquaticum TaxID=2613962 RepID=A0A5J5GAT2_9RHOB|nr:H-NS histone family protein [Histidinibacterium aquaticum]KAA9005219.1 H-NS histone family protein [Histidinibacterium aquaticum]